MVFELLTNNYLFKPKKGPGFGKSDDHLALMIETLGKMNKNLALGGKKSREYFNKNGQLIRVKVHFDDRNLGPTKNAYTWAAVPWVWF